jgi:hypothetical protein
MLTNLIGKTVSVPYGPSHGKPGGTFKAWVIAVFSAETSTEHYYKFSDKQDHVVTRTHKVLVSVVSNDEGIISGPHDLNILTLED